MSSEIILSPGIYTAEELSNEQYHSHPAISKSGLDQVNRSPAHYKAWLEEPSKETPALVFGSAFHMAILEPEKFKQTYISNPGINRRTKAGKAEWDALMASGVTVLPDDDFRAIEGMRASLFEHPISRTLIVESEHETSGIWRNIEYEVDVKCRPDIWHEGKGIIADLKSTNDAREESFGKSSYVYRYDVQAAFYRDIWYNLTHQPVRAFLFIAVEKEPPYAVKVHNVPPHVMAFGRQRYRLDLDMYARCLREDFWPAYSPDIADLELPKWVMQ